MDGPAALDELRDQLDSGSLLMEGQAAEFANPPWEGSGIRILILRLSPFSDVCRSTPHLFLFRACRSAFPAAFLDFSFFPTPADRGILEKNGLPLMYGIASRRGLREFDIVLISNSYTLELVNLPFALSRSGLPPTRSLRDESAERSPLILLGGSNSSAASALLEDPVSGSGDCIVDALFFGEGEDEVPAMLARLDPAKGGAPGYTADEKKRLLLKMAEAAPGLFFPGKASRSKQARRFSAAAGAFAAYPLLNSPEASSYKLPISSGCPSFCRFCMESWDRKPYRETPVDALIEEARAAKRALGATALDIASFNFNAHSQIVRLMSGLSRLFHRLNATSQRADILEGVPGLLSFEFSSGKRSFTVGVEGISERMRRFYAKELDAQRLRALLDRLIAAGAREIKLFYIVSGFESEDDQAEFAAFVKELKRSRSDSSSGTRIVFSAGYLTRMPGTPLAFAPLALDEARLRRISGPLKSSCETNGFEFRMPAFFDEYALGQVLALGGPGLFALLLGMAESGYCYDGKLARGAWEFARERLERSGVLVPEFLGEKTPGYPFSLGFLDFSTDPDFRYRSYLDARAELAPRRGSDPEPGLTSCLAAACLACGACLPRSPQQDAILRHTIAPPGMKDTEEAARLQRLKAKAGLINALIDVPLDLYGADSAFLSAFYLRRFLSERPDQTDNILEFEECLFSHAGMRERFPSFCGSAVFRIRAFDPRALSAAAAGLDWLTLPEREPQAQFELSSADVLVFLPSGSLSELEKTLCRYLDEEVANYTLSRDASGAARWEISRGGLKKRVVIRARGRIDAALGPLLEIRIGPRFDFSRIAAIHRRGYPGKASPRIRFLTIAAEGKKPC